MRVCILPFHSLSSSKFYTGSLQNAIRKQLLIFNKSKLLEFYKLISLNYVSPTDSRLVKQLKNCISMQAENRLSAPKQVAMQTVIFKLANKIYLLSRLKWRHKTCAYVYFLTKLYLAPTCVIKLQGFLDIRCFLASPRNYMVTLTLTGHSCKMSCQYPRINQSQVYCFVITLMNTSFHEYKNSSNKHIPEKNKN